MKDIKQRAQELIEVTANQIAADEAVLGIKYPALPEPERIGGNDWFGAEFPLFTAQQMEEYARQAIVSNAISPEFDVRTILLDVVPGNDGMGKEIYALNVDDVVREMTKMDERHHLETVKAGYPVRALYASKQEPSEIRNSAIDDCVAIVMGAPLIESFGAHPYLNQSCKAMAVSVSSKLIDMKSAAQPQEKDGL